MLTPAPSALDNLADNLTVILLAAGNLLMAIDQDDPTFPNLRTIEEMAQRAAFTAQMLGKQAKAAAA